MGLYNRVPLQDYEELGMQPAHTEGGALNSMEENTNVYCQFMEEGGGVLEGLLVGSGSRGGVRISAASSRSQILVA